MAVFGRWGYRGSYRKGEVKIRYTKLLIITEIIGVAIVLGILIYTAYKYSVLPDSVPTHYGVNGEADAWGGKGHLWFVPVAAVFLYLLITVAGFFPNSWNYPAKIKSEKLPEAEGMMRRMMMYVKLLIMIMFAYLQYEILSLSGNVSLLVTFGIVIIMFGVIIYFILGLKKLY